MLHGTFLPPTYKAHCEHLSNLSGILGLLRAFRAPLSVTWAPFTVVLVAGEVAAALEGLCFVFEERPAGWTPSHRGCHEVGLSLPCLDPSLVLDVPW